MIFTIHTPIPLHQNLLFSDFNSPFPDSFALHAELKKKKLTKNDEEKDMPSLISEFKDDITGVIGLSSRKVTSLSAEGCHLISLR